MAFRDDPMMNFLYDEKDDRQMNMTLTSFFSSYIFEQKNAVLVVAKDGPECSTALWLPPSDNGFANTKPKTKCWSFALWTLLVAIFFVLLGFFLTSW